MKKYLLYEAKQLPAITTSCLSTAQGLLNLGTLLCRKVSEPQASLPYAELAYTC